MFNNPLDTGKPAAGEGAVNIQVFEANGITDNMGV